MDIREKLELFVERCKEKKLKITPQRVAVYEVLLKSKEHPTVEEIYNQIKEKYPYVSMATVYRTVEILENIGLVKRVCYWGNSTRYDANLEDHHHFICIKCGSIRDVSFNGNINVPEEIEGYTINSVAVNMYGICPSCKN